MPSFSSVRNRILKMAGLRKDQNSQKRKKPERSGLTRSEQQRLARVQTIIEKRKEQERASRAVWASAFTE